MIEAIIFDLDGVISDTNSIHAQIESDLLKMIGIDMDPAEIIDRYAGVRTDHFFQELAERYDVKCDVDKLIAEKNKKLFAAANKGINSIPGVIELITTAQNQGLNLAVASGSDKDFIELVLKKLNIADKFRAVVSSEEVDKGKPNPDIFLLAAQKLSVAPNKCVVIEDGINGILGAKAANMKCVGLTKNKNVPADLIIDSFQELNITKLVNL